ncbi:MAG: beta-ketoacyl synthase chain length factor [Usitatibacter sp.]
MRIAIDAVGLLAPGLPDWEGSREVIAGNRPHLAAPLPPCAPASLSPTDRRRSSPTVRLAIAAAEQALHRTSIEPQDMALVFASPEAAGVITHQLCEELAGSREVSPTQFHNSVHNAPSGYYSIAMNAKLGATSVCRGPWTFAAGLLGAAVQALCDEVPVLYVCYDSPLPAPLSDVMPVVEATVIALVIARNPAPGALASWELSITPAEGAVPWPSWMPEAWQANASARGFEALATICGRPDASALLPLSPELNVQVARC